ncbi:hypothetical protein KR044_010121 [Drosophila immigrans]|nr:hypothetical protein KR044_010121 [Drosophila immigrans]
MENIGNTNSVERGICQTVADETLPQQQLHLNPNPNPQPYSQTNFIYPSHYPEYLQQLAAANFSPYYYHLAQMDIERYINFEVSKQQQLIAKQQQPPPLPPPPPRPALVPIQLPIAPRIQLPPKKAMRHPILNVKVDKKVEPLPGVKEAFKADVKHVEQTQAHYTMLFDRLSSMLETLSRRFAGVEEEPEPEDEETEEPPPPPAKRQRPSDRSGSSSPDCDPLLGAYPKRIDLADGSFNYVLGPNGTVITAKEFGQVFWTNAPIATRCLLAACFTGDELATHTLTGKPSPAFYGRERPPKKMLDPQRVADIVVSVRNRTGGKERHIRSTITTKCADTAKKYKRRAKKAAEIEAINLGEQ